MMPMMRNVMYTALEPSGMNVGSDSCSMSQDAAEQVRDGQPQVDADVAHEPLGERGLEAVPAGQGERDGTQYGKHDQEECPERVDDQRGGVEHQFQQLAEEILHGLLHVVHRAVHIHPAGLNCVQSSQFVQLVVERLLVHQVGRLGIPPHRLELQPVLLLPVLVHVEGLRFQYPVRSGHNG